MERLSKLIKSFELQIIEVCNEIMPGEYIWENLNLLRSDIFITS